MQRLVCLVAGFALSSCLMPVDEPRQLVANPGSDGGAAVDGGQEPIGPVTCTAAPPGVAWVARPLMVLTPPVADPTGVACAGDELWLVSGGHNAPSHRLVRYDTVDGGVPFDHSYQGLIEAAGTGVYGLAVGGNSVWLSVSGNRNKLVEVDATTGALGRTLGSPTVLGPSDLEVDGQSLVVSTGTGELYRLTTGAVPTTARLFATQGLLGRDVGVATAGNEWLVAGLFGELQAYSSTGGLVGQVVRPDGSSFTSERLGPLCVDGTRLVVAERSGLAVYELCRTAR